MLGAVASCCVAVFVFCLLVVGLLYWLIGLLAGRPGRPVDLGFCLLRSRLGAAAASRAHHEGEEQAVGAFPGRRAGHALRHATCGGLGARDDRGAVTFRHLAQLFQFLPI